MKSNFDPKILSLSEDQRNLAWQQVVAAIESYTQQVQDLKIPPNLDRDSILEQLAPFDFARPIEPKAVIDFIVTGLRKHQLHFSNPGYLGLYVPRAGTMSVLADSIASGFNCQLAAWRSAPFSIEVELHLIRALGRLFGYDPAQIDGVFTTGGSEANATALTTALVHSFPEFSKEGLRSLKLDPVVYTSSEAHHSIHKAIQVFGLGLKNLREVSVDASQRMNCQDLQEKIQQDRKNNKQPFMVIGTFGTTNSAAIDPVAQIADIAKNENLWFHLDAAYGGPTVLLPQMANLFLGSSRADSITLDPHKWMSIAMGEGVFLTRHKNLLKKTFSVDSPYVARSTVAEAVDPHLQSLQWSRRFLGLKLFMSLAVTGWDGYVQLVTHQIELADIIRKKLKETGWKIVNNTPLPVVCFVDENGTLNDNPEYLVGVTNTVVESGKIWISTTKLSGSRTVVRLGVVNFMTGNSEVELLLQLLAEARVKTRNRLNI